MRRVLMFGVVSLFLTDMLFAGQNGVSLKTKSFVQKVVVDKSGHRKVVLKEAKKVIPGDIVVYKNSIINHTNKKVKDMVLDNVIPKHTVYVDQSAKCQKDCEILFSVDGGKSYDKPQKLMVKEGNRVRKALPSDYTNVKWILTSSLEPNSVTDVSFKTKLQ